MGRGRGSPARLRATLLAALPRGLLLAGLLAPAAAQGPIPVGPDLQFYGVSTPGVNLFDIIGWDQVETSTPCNVGGIVVDGPSIAYDEDVDATGIPMEAFAGCAEFRFHYRAPYPTDHIHVRFGADVNYTFLGSESPFVGNATLAAEGPDGTVVPSSFLTKDVSYEELWGRENHGWVQDPGDGFPLHFKGPQQEGDVVWRFQDRADVDDTPLRLSPLSTGHMKVKLYSDFVPEDLFFISDVATTQLPFNPSHVEYSFVALPGTTLKEEHVVRDGRDHLEYHYRVPLSAELLDRYWASIQLQFGTDITFSRIVLPDGTNVTRTYSVDHNDWRGLAYEVAQIQALTNLRGAFQVTVPATLIRHAGPGVYDLVVEKPGASLLVADAQMTVVLVILLILPALVALIALRNLRRLLVTIGAAPDDAPGTPRSVLVLWFVGLVLAHLFIVAFVFGVGLDRVARSSPDSTGLLVLFFLLFITAGHTLLAARGSDRVIRTMRGQIDRHQQTQAELVASEKELEFFASTAVHDLGAPLRGVAGFAAILERDHGRRLDPAGRELLNHVVTGARRMQDLVRSLLDFAKAQDGHADVEDVELGVLAKQVIDSAQPQARAADATITVGKLPTVRGSHADLTRVLQNLVENAIKFRHPDRAPEIRIEARRAGDLWDVSIRDNGIGIPSSELSDMGRPFRRAKTQQRYDGSGLGLASSQRMLESTEGKGTTVHFFVPAVRGDKPRGGKGAASAPA